MNTGTISARLRAFGLAAISVLWAIDASALSYCDASNPCKLATDTCHGSVCVPQAKLCTSTTSCTAWQVCDFTCPGSSIAITDPAPPPGSADASSGAAPAPSADAGSAAPIMPPPDASEMPMPVDAGTTDVSPYIPPNCPKDVGVCIVDPAKVAPMPGCQEFCTALIACGNVGIGGGGSSGGNGGGSTPPPLPGGDSSSPGFAPPAPGADAGASDKMPMPADAGTGIAMPDDAASYDTDSSSGDIGGCIQLCSVLVLENVAHKELVDAEQCVATYAAQCADLATQCAGKLQIWEQAASADDSWSLGFYSSFGGGGVAIPPDSPDGFVSADGGTTSGGADGGSVFSDAVVAADALINYDTFVPKGADGSSTSGGADAGPTGSNADAGLQSDSSATSSPTSTTPSSASACTASSSSPGHPWSLAALALICIVALRLRRRETNAG